jgi:hypothetical protein
VSQNTLLVVQVIIAMGGVITSVTVSAFLSGARWGRVETDMRFMADRLAKIEGMFTLRLKDDGDPPHH